MVSKTPPMVALRTRIYDSKIKSAENRHAEESRGSQMEPPRVTL